MNPTRVRPALAAAVLIGALAVALPNLAAGDDTRERTPGRSAPATTSVSLHFLDEAAYATGTEPYTRTVTRTVPAEAPAGGALTALFAGPTAAESAKGLRFVASGATGFRDLTISDGVARLRLVGGCASGGSTLTVANLIVETLKEFATVDRVEIYPPAGPTGRAAGDADLIPECLEP